MDLRIGIIGIGGLGYLQAETYADIKGVTIVGGADVSNEACKLFMSDFDAPAYEDYRELLTNHSDEMDAVTIVTPHTLHYEQVKACLSEGLHVLVEKPMTTDVGHAVELVELAQDQGLILQVGYQRHFHPGFQELRRLIAEGRIGEVHTVSCHLGQNWVDLHRDDWRMNPELSGGGQLYDSGSHLLDAILWTLDQEPVSVMADIQYIQPNIDVNSILGIRLGQDESILVGATISGDGITLTPSEQYTFWGDKGRLSYNGDGEIAIVEKEQLTYRTQITGGTDFRELNWRKIDNFVQSIDGEVSPAVPGELGIQVTALTEAAYQAASDNSRVSIDRIINRAIAK